MSSADTYGTVSGLGLLYNVGIGKCIRGLIKRENIAHTERIVV